MGRLCSMGGWVLLAVLSLGITGCGSAPTLSIGAPSVADTSHGPVSFAVTYEGAQAITLAAAQVSLQSTGTATGTISVSGTGETSRTVTIANISGDGTLAVRLDEGTALSASKQPAPAAGPSATVRVDNTAPSATLGAPSAAATNTGPVAFTVTYDGATSISLAQANVQLIATGSATATIDEVTGSDNISRTVTLSGIAGDGTLAISIPAGTASDAAGNLAPEIAPSATVTVDNTPPGLSISAPSTAATAAGPVDYKVNYEGADAITLSKAKVLVNGTGTTGAILEEVSATGDAERTVTLSNIIGNGTLGISIAAGTASDAAGNPAPEAGPSATFAVNNVAPTLNISEPSAPETFDGPITFVITYADAQTITLSPEDITLNSEGGVTAMVAVSGTGNAERTVTLSDINGQGPASISVAGRTAVNSAAVQAGTAGPSATFKVNPLLAPGTGFTEPTPQPDPIGAPGAPGIDAKAIARWDVVPYQTFDGYFNVGVVAFHINDIDRVEFSVQGGPWTAVKEMTLNPQTNVVEYWVGIDARDFPDGPIEVRAVAYPKVGVPRVLGSAMTAPESIDKGEHAMFLNTNATGTLPEIVMYVSNSGNDATGDGSQGAPFLTIMKAARAIQDASPAGNADGGRILLAAGEYVLGTYTAALDTVTANRWLAVESAPEVAREDVRITSGVGDRLRTRLVQLRNLSLAPASGASQSILDSNGPLVDYYWVDACELVGPGQTVDGRWVASVTDVYFTESDLSESRDSIVGSLVRNIHVGNIGSDAFTGAGLVANAVVASETIATDFHGDVWQFNVNDGSTIENRIGLNIRADTRYGQGLFAGRGISIKDVAFVDCGVNNQQADPPTAARVFQFMGPTEHLYILRCEFKGTAAWRVSEGFVGKNVVVEETTFTSPPASFVEGVTYRPPLIKGTAGKG